MSSGISRLVLFTLVFAALGMRADAVFVDPPQLRLQVARGEHATAQVNVKHGATSVAFSFDSFLLSEDGRPQRGAAHARDLTKWGGIKTVRGDGDTTVRFNLDVPVGAEGSYWAALSVTLPKADGVVARVVVPVFLTVAGTERPSVESQGLRATLGRDGVGAQWRLRNDGNTVVFARGAVDLTVRDSPDVPLEVASHEEPRIMMLPGSVREVRITLPLSPDSAAGPMDVNATLRYANGPDDVLNVSVPVHPGVPAPAAHL